MLPIILQKCLPMAKDVARKSCNRMLWVTSRTINLLSHLTVRLTIVVLTLVKFHLQKCEQCILFLAGWKKNCSPSGFLLFHMHLQISVFHHLKNCSRGVACRRAHSEQSRAEQTGLLLGAAVKIYNSWMIRWPCFIVMQGHISAEGCLTDVFLIDFGQRQSHGGPHQAEYHWN